MATSRILLLCLTLSLFLCGFGSCTDRVEDLCRQGLDAPYENARLALQPWQPGASRSPASAPASDSALALALVQRDRQAWQDWSAERLKEVEGLLDLTYGRTQFAQVREELSSVATDLVSFYGFSSQGRPDQMLGVLRKIQAHTQKIRTLACH